MDEQLTGGPALAPDPIGGNPAVRRLPFRRRVRASTVAVIAAVGLGVVLRLHSSSPLWLDEALSVDIASRSWPHLLDGLRADGSPPLYYLLLHGWIAVVGGSDDAVRALSTLTSVGALPVAYLVGRRLAGSGGGRAALLLAATNPFLVRYATETRMYSLVVLLALTGVLVALRAADRPTVGRLSSVGLIAGLLSLTHYWALFLLAIAVVGLVMVGVVRRTQRSATWRIAGATVAGAVLFVPWLPTFLFQVAHTGTPWATPPGPADVAGAVDQWAGGLAGWSWLLGAALVALTIVAVLPARWAGAFLPDTSPAAVPPALSRVRLLAGLAAGTLGLGLSVSALLHSGFAVRYSAPSAALIIVCGGVGLVRFSRRFGATVTAFVVLLGSGIAVHNARHDDRSQAGETARLLTAAGAGDLIVYCPDQLGPAVGHALAEFGPIPSTQVVYPTLGSPDLVDWVDYAARNAAADPQAVAGRVNALAAGRIWLVTRGGYLTFGDQCEQLTAALAALRGAPELLQRADDTFGENADLLVFPATGS